MLAVADYTPPAPPAPPAVPRWIIGAGCVCLLLLAVGVVSSDRSPGARPRLRRVRRSRMAPELRAAPATAVPTVAPLPAATARPGVPVGSPEQVAAELPDAPATAVPTVAALPAATDAPTVEPAEMPWADGGPCHCS